MVEEQQKTETIKPKRDKAKIFIAIIAIVALIIAIYDFEFTMSVGTNLQNEINTLTGNTTPTTLKTVGLGTNPVKGDVNAPITIVEFSDFQCPYCGAAEGTNQDVIAQFKQQYPTWTPTIPDVITNYINTGKAKLYYRNFPLTTVHQYALNASLAAECANEQGKFWEYHDKLFANQNSLTVTDLKSYAAGLGLNTAQFDSCLDTSKYNSTVMQDETDGIAYGIGGTPTFIIGTPAKGYQLVVGAVPYDQIKSVIDSYAS
jgi:protein-disulfide isomerase